MEILQLFALTEALIKKRATGLFVYSQKSGGLIIFARLI